MENKLEELIKKPLELVLVTDGLDNDVVKNIVNYCRGFKCKAFKRGNMLRLEFPFEEATKISLQEFGENLSTISQKEVKGKIIDKKLGFTFGKGIE